MGTKTDDRSGSNQRENIDPQGSENIILIQEVNVENKNDSQSSASQDETKDTTSQALNEDNKPQNDQATITNETKTEENAPPQDIESIQKLPKAASGEIPSSGFSPPITIDHDSKQSDIDSVSSDFTFDLSFTQVNAQKIFLIPVDPIEPPPVNHPITISDLTDKSLGADAVVNENNLLATRGANESAGSAVIKGSVTAQGDFKITAPDGIGVLSIDGHAVIQNGIFTATTISTTLGNKLVITAYDAQTGVLSYQYKLLDNEQHPQGNGTNDLFDDINIFAKDSNGDTANGTLSVRIIDDVPSIQVSQSTAVVTVDESSLTTPATASFAGLFTSVPGADGATIAYKLSISQSGVDSGLIESQTGSHVLLFMNGNDVVGRIGSIEVFRLSIDTQSGIVKLTQSRPLVQSDTTDPNDAATLATSNLINLTATITDGDGDTKSATTGIATSLQFLDDGPNIDITFSSQTHSLAVYDGHLDQNASAIFSDTFLTIITPGADGVASVTTNYSLSCSVGADSGLVDSLTGEHILLTMNGNVVEGRTASSNALAFTVSVDASTSKVTLDGMRPIVQSGDSTTLSDASLIKLNVSETVYDKDGDSSTGTNSLNIGQSLIFYDDVPTTNADVATLIKPVALDYNLTFVLDISGSMASAPSGATQSSISILKAAMAGVLNAYAAEGNNLAITIISFSDSATTSTEFHSINDAISYVNSLSPSGNTNYEAAYTAAINDIANDKANSTLSGYTNELYWISDGQPSAGMSLSSTDYTNWYNTLNDNHINPYAINIGTGSNASNAQLQALALESDHYFFISNQNQLGSTLVDTASQHISVEGNVLNNDSAGGDGNLSVASVSFLFSTAQAANAYLNANSSLHGTLSGTTVTIGIPNGDISTPLGNTLHIDANGDFTYSTTTYNSQDTIYYTAKDGDGDTSTSTLSFNVTTAAAPIVLDLNNNGFELTPVNDSNIQLTIDNQAVKSGWVSPNDALLTYNYSGEGAIENKNFILTENVPGAQTDLQALQGLAGQQSGILDKSNAIWDKLGVWQDSNQNGKMDSGEFHTLTELGIKSIDLGSAQTVEQNVNGNIVHSTLSFNYTDGSVGKAADVALKYEDVIQANNNIQGLHNEATTTSSPSSSNTSTAASTTITPAPAAVDSTVHSAVEAVVQQHPVSQG